MTTFHITLIVNVTVLAVILGGDLGRRKVTTMRIIRPLIVVVAAVAIFFHSAQPTSNDLSLQLVGAGVGVLLGLVAGAMLPAEMDDAGTVHTRAGLPYALFWVTMSAARAAFVYGSEHWFTGSVIRSAIRYRISGPEIFGNALVLMALATVLGRSAVVMINRRWLRSAATPAGH